jgi:hypothetical protein
MKTPSSFPLQIQEVLALFTIRGRSLWWLQADQLPRYAKDAIGNLAGTEVTLETFDFSGDRLITRHLVWAAAWGRYPTFPLHRQDLFSGLGDPSNYFEAVPKDFRSSKAARAALSGQETWVASRSAQPGSWDFYQKPLSPWEKSQGLRAPVIFRVIPPTNTRTPLEYRKVSIRSFHDRAEGEKWAIQRFAEAGLNFSRRTYPGGYVYAGRSDQLSLPSDSLTGQPVVLALEKEKQPGRDKDRLDELFGPSITSERRAPPLILPDDGYDPPGLWANAAPQGPLRPPPPPPSPSTQEGWEALPAPPVSLPGDLDMLSFKAITRFCTVALRLQEAHQGTLPAPNTGRPGVRLTLTLGALDGAWRALSECIDGTGTVRQDLRESQPEALSIWNIQETVILGKTLRESPKELRLALMKRWKAGPPSEEARKAARSLWTTAPVPRLGVDLRTSTGPSQTVLGPIPGTSQETNVELLLEQMLSGMAFAKEHCGEWVSITKVSLTLKRTSYGFTLLLKGATEPNGNRRTLCKRAIKSQIPAAKVREHGQKALLFSRMNSRSKLLALAPEIVSKIQERLKLERET